MARKITGEPAPDAIPAILGQDIEVGQTAVCAVEEEAEDMFEKFDDGQVLGVLAHGAVKPFDVRKKGNAPEVAGKRVETSRADQAIVRNLDIIDELCF